MGPGLARAVRVAAVASVAAFVGDAWAQGGGTGTPAQVPPPPSGLQAAPGTGGGGTPWWNQGTTASSTGAGQALGHGGGQFRWRRFFSHPRIGGRVTAVSVDPHDSARLFVGSEEGTVFRSFDGGATWDERALSPFVIIDRALRSAQPGLPRLGQSSPPSLRIFVIPPYQTIMGIPHIPSVGGFPAVPGGPTSGLGAGGLSQPQNTLLPSVSVPGPTGSGFNWGGATLGSTFPSFMRPIIVSPPSAVPALLRTVVSSRRRYTDPVKNIAICPGNQYPILVATHRNLYGSVDDGLSYERLFAVPGGVPIVWISCDPAHPNHLALATGFGLYRSEDGGLSFDQDTSGWPGAGVTAIAYGGNGGFFTANGTILFHRSAENPDDNVMVYPDFNNSATAPWANIRYIQLTESGQIWLATDDGVRASPDGGTNWEVPARTLFANRRILQVVSGVNERGGERIVVLVGPGTGAFQGKLWASDDGGRDWFPFFEGITNRAMLQVATTPAPPGQPPRWFLAGGNEVWSTVEPSELAPQPPGDLYPAAAAWARDQLAHLPSIYTVIDAALDHTGLRPDRVQAYTDGLSWRAFLPVVGVYFNWQSMSGASNYTRAGIGPQILGGLSSQPEWQIFVQGVWYLRDLALIPQQINTFQNETHELRRQLTFAAEDAWRERVQHLQRMARGNLSAYQCAVLRSRIDTIDAALEVWLGRPLRNLDLR